MAAGAALAPAHQFQEEIPLVLDHRLFGSAAIGIAFDQPPSQRHIAGGDQQLAVGIFTVASGAADLLVVGLYRAGRSQVGDGAHIGAVDPHAEGVGGDDDLNPVLDEIALDLVAIRPSHAGVIGCCPPAGILEADGFLFGDLAGRGVYDGRTGFLVRSAEGFGQQRVDPLTSLGGAADLGDPQCEVGAGKAAQQLRGVSGQSEAFEDLVAHYRCGSRCTGENPGVGQAAQQLADLQIFGAEVVTPLADAVGFVDGDQRALDLAQERAEAREAQPFGRGVDEFVLAVGDALHAATNFVAIERRGQVGGGEAPALERLDLIVHQRDQRRDHQGRSRQQGGGQLVG